MAVCITRSPDRIPVQESDPDALSPAGHQPAQGIPSCLKMYLSPIDVTGA